jgi:hypothetical protein
MYRDQSRLFEPDQQHKLNHASHRAISFKKEGRDFMEHRCGERIATDIPVTVHKPDHQPIRGVMRNLSCGGAFLRLPDDQAMLRGSVYVELRLPYAESRRCRWQAFVVHHQPDGVGLMFDDRQLGDFLPLLAAQKAMNSSVQAHR